MVQSHEPTNPPKTPPGLRTQKYVLHPSLHPHGWKLEVRESTGNLLYEILRHPTQPIQFKLQSPKSQTNNLLKIKTRTIGDVLRYSLFEGKQEQLSLRLIPNAPVVLLRNQERKTIARFSPLRPDVVILRTPTASVARLRFKEKPSPLHFQIECETVAGEEWFYAIILYTVARIEAAQPEPLRDNEVMQDEDEGSDSGETVTP